MDLVEKCGDWIDTAKLSEKLGCQVVEISALKGTGIMNAAEKAMMLAKEKKVGPPVHKFSVRVENVLERIEGKLGSGIPEEQKRFFAIKTSPLQK